MFLLVLFCFFLDGESKFFKRKVAKFFYEHGMHERNESFRQFREFRVQK